MFHNKRLMITGGTGSFGKTVLNRFIDTSIKEIIIFSRDEKKQEDLRIKLRSDKVSFVIGDVRDQESIDFAMRGVDYVFHAAALKQVPSCEFFPMEAVRTNINGTENVVRAAIRNGISRLILLSTDKAVYPINAMGISKAMAEKILISKALAEGSGGPIMCATRYGNVMASRGSVIPLFIEKILSGQALRVTDPRMTRFMMSLEDSVDLVLHAFEHGNQGDIFVQKAPACTLENLASALQALFGSNVPIEVMGTRHGEKLYETLVSREEMAKVEDLGRYYRIPADSRGLNYELFISEGNVNANALDDYTSHNTKQLDVMGVKTLMESLPYVRNMLSR